MSRGVPRGVDEQGQVARQQHLDCRQSCADKGRAEIRESHLNHSPCGVDQGERA